MFETELFPPNHTSFVRMRKLHKGIPSLPKQMRLFVWAYEQSYLYLPTQIAVF